MLVQDLGGLRGKISRMRRSFAVWSMVLALASAACTRPKLPTVTAERGDVTSMTAEGVTLVAHLAADNPNPVDIPIQGFEAKMKIDGRYDVGPLRYDRALVLPAHQRAPLEVPLVVSWPELASLAALALQGRPLPFQIEGTVALGGSLLHTTVPFVVQGVMTPADLLQIAARSVTGAPGVAH